ncbi:MAG: tetratricopeptide repeat protein [Myxococcota bacterium]
MTTSRDVEKYRPLFKLLRVVSDGAARDAELAVDYAENDPEGSVAKVRRATEAILRSLLPKGTKRPEALDFEEMRKLVAKAAPRKVMVLVGTVQGLGNEGAHARPDRLEPAYAYQVLDALAGISEWYLFEHRKIARPRASRAPWLIAGLAAATGATVMVGVGALWLIAAAVSAPTTSIETVATAPVPIVVATPVPVAATVAPVTISGVSLWSRPWLPWEDIKAPPAGHAPPAGAPLQPCRGSLSGLSVVSRAGGWLRIHATCGTAAVDGWLLTTALQGTPIAVPAAEPFDYSSEETALLYEAKAVLDAKRWTEAVTSYGRVIALVPNDPSLYEQRALARLRGGDPSAALDDAAVCLALAPKTGRCHLYVAEAMQQLALSGWEQVLADAVQHDPALAGEASALRGSAVSTGADIRRITGSGGRGVPLSRAKMRLPAYQKLKDTPADSDRRERCRLRDGAPVEVLSTELGWHEVRTYCDGVATTGYLPQQLESQFYPRP